MMKLGIVPENLVDRLALLSSETLPLRLTSSSR
jgi:hypothetical protein